MEFLKNQLSRIQQQLKGLSASQRMLAGALVIIMVMTVFWWTHYAGKSEMEPVLDQALSAEESRLITAQLKTAGIPYKTVGDRVHVPSDRKDEAIVALGVAQVLPQDTKNAFDEMIKQSNPFQPSRMQDAMWNQAKQSVLSRYISRFPSVSQAVVIVDPTRERGPNGTMPTAVVNLTMRSGQAADRRLADACADMVAGAVANLARERVRVVINGVSWRIRPRDEGTGGDSDEYLEKIQKAEQHYVRKVREYLQFIDNPMISVSVTPNFKTVKMHETKVDPKNVVAKPVVEENANDETTMSQKASGEPGVKSNAGMDLGENAAGENSNSTNEKNRTEYMVQAGKAETETFHPGGELPLTSVAVLIPRSHFISDYRLRTNADSDPDPQVLEDYTNNRLTKLKVNLKTGLGLATDDAVQLDSYADAPVSAAGSTQAASTSIGVMLNGHVKEVALGVLALASLLLMSQIVRKSTPAPVVHQQQAPVKPQPLPGPEEAVGEAIEGSPMLDGMEVDEDSVKAQQMLSQVQEMVGDNPDSAAALVKRWLNRS